MSFLKRTVYDASDGSNKYSMTVTRKDGSIVSRRYKKNSGSISRSDIPQSAMQKIIASVVDNTENKLTKQPIEVLVGITKNMTINEIQNNLCAVSKTLKERVCTNKFFWQSWASAISTAHFYEIIKDFALYTDWNKYMPRPEGDPYWNNVRDYNFTPRVKEKHSRSTPLYYFVMNILIKNDKFNVNTLVEKEMSKFVLDMYNANLEGAIFRVGPMENFVYIMRNVSAKKLAQLKPENFYRYLHFLLFIIKSPAYLDTKYLKRAKINFPQMYATDILFESFLNRLPHDYAAPISFKQRYSADFTLGRNGPTVEFYYIPKVNVIIDLALAYDKLSRRTLKRIGYVIRYKSKYDEFLFQYLRMWYKAPTTNIPSRNAYDIDDRVEEIYIEEDLGVFPILLPILSSWENKGDKVNFRWEFPHYEDDDDEEED